MQKVDVVRIGQELIGACIAYFPQSESADILHAATSLETGAILIMNDRHFRKLKESGRVKIWSMTEAIKTLLRRILRDSL